MKIPRLQLKRLVKHILLEIQSNEKFYEKEQETFKNAINLLQYEDSYISNAKQKSGQIVVFDVVTMNSVSKNGKLVNRKDKISKYDRGSGKKVERFQLDLENYKKLLQYIGNLKKRHMSGDTERYYDGMYWMGLQKPSETPEHPEPPSID